MGGWTGTDHYTIMKYDRPSMYSTPVNRSRSTVKHDRPNIISNPMNSTVDQYAVEKYIVLGLFCVQGQGMLAIC